ncbi:MAG: hypothetical protein AB3N21_06480 [Ruegeria sp.]|uniref:hypothetical protein n=1 Tax=Ruegeria sp. TaxID=1879320 RepID=UPI00349E4DBA
MQVFSMTRGDYSSFFTQLLFLPLFAVYATVAYGKSEDVVTVPKVSYSYAHENAAGQLVKREFDVVALSRALTGLGFDTKSWTRLEPETIDALKSNPLTQPLGLGLEQGGMPAVAATVILNVSTIGAEECAKLSMVPYKTPILGRSSMHAIQNTVSPVNYDGLGRGQFDIWTTKFVLCRDDMTNEISGIPINIRWVFNINGNSLKTTRADPNGPPLKGPNGGDYRQNFHARGLGIQMVLLQINGVARPKGDPVYKISADSCIDIWFVDYVDDFDISVPASIPNFGVFCAGGSCKDKPPWLDATQ